MSDVSIARAHAPASLLQDRAAWLQRCAGIGDATDPTATAIALRDGAWTISSGHLQATEDAPDTESSGVVLVPHKPFVAALKSCDGPTDVLAAERYVRVTSPTFTADIPTISADPPARMAEPAEWQAVDEDARSMIGAVAGIAAIAALEPDTTGASTVSVHDGGILAGGPTWWAMVGEPKGDRQASVRPGVFRLIDPTSLHAADDRLWLGDGVRTVCTLGMRGVQHADRRDQLARLPEVTCSFPAEVLASALGRVAWAGEREVVGGQSYQEPAAISVERLGLRATIGTAEAHEPCHPEGEGEFSVTPRLVGAAMRAAGDGAQVDLITTARAKTLVLRGPWTVVLCSTVVAR